MRCPMCYIEVTNRFYEKHIAGKHNRPCYVPGCDAMCMKTRGTSSAGLARHVRELHPGQMRKRGHSQGPVRSRIVAGLIPSAIQFEYIAAKEDFAKNRLPQALSHAHDFHAFMCIRHAVKRRLQ